MRSSFRKIHLMLITLVIKSLCQRSLSLGSQLEDSIKEGSGKEETITQDSVVMEATKDTDMSQEDMMTIQVFTELIPFLIFFRI